MVKDDIRRSRAFDRRPAACEREPERADTGARNGAAAADLAERGALVVLGPTSTQVASVLQVAGLENHFTRDEHL